LATPPGSASERQPGRCDGARPAPAVPGRLARDRSRRGAVNESLTRFVGCDACGVQSLRHDLARFTFLLGESDGEGLFSPSIPD
jgi:hypothetical protein